jgi:hypothetical protein
MVIPYLDRLNAWDSGRIALRHRTRARYEPVRPAEVSPDPPAVHDRWTDDSDEVLPLGIGAAPTGTTAETEPFTSDPDRPTDRRPPSRAVNPPTSPGTVARRPDSAAPRPSAPTSADEPPLQFQLSPPPGLGSDPEPADPAQPVPHRGMTPEPPQMNAPTHDLPRLNPGSARSPIRPDPHPGADDQPDPVDEGPRAELRPPARRPVVSFPVPAPAPAGRHPGAEPAVGGRSVEPVLQVSIGRIHVRVQTAPDAEPAPRRSVERARPSSLDDYLDARSVRRRS